MSTDWLRAQNASVNRRKGVLTITMVGDIVVVLPLSRINAVFPNALPVDDPRIKDVRVEDNGATIEWPSLEIDFSVAEMLPEFLGIVTARAVARKAGQTKSKARATAARANGTKGGRPRKTVAVG
ncbi:MAG: hypothetical protein ACLPYS_13865 [Vulcanimicrobiaceae bacterium]|jgi:hypothetical protein